MTSFSVKHSLPHRVRFKVPAVRNCETTARRLEKYADEVEGVHWARANTRCAGLVVRYDASRLTERDIVELFMTQTVKRSV